VDRERRYRKKAMKSTLSVIGAVVGGALLVGACDAQDQGRPLNYKKGVYLGKPHTPLAEQTLEDLRDRATYQAGLSTVTGGGGQVITGTASANVRPPATSDVDTGALRQRAGYQAGAATGGGKATVPAASSVRPPAAAGIVDMDALRRRAGRQSQ
jgi:hypothetical protein